MSKNDNIATEMADIMTKMTAEWAADDAEKARKYKIASVFLAERMLDDLELVKIRLYLKEAVGSYVIRQREAANTSLTNQITNTKNLIVFLKKADQDYFIGNEKNGTTNVEAVRLLKTFADYFRGDCNNLQLAKISDDIQDFHISNMDSIKSVADAIVSSLERSVSDIFKKS